MLIRRWMSALLCLVMCAAMMGAGQAEDAAAFAMAGFDDTSMREWKDNRFFERMQEITGMRFTFSQFTKREEWTAYKAALETGSELPDVLFKADLTSAECIALREKGVLVDLKPYLPEYAPHVWAILQENPDALAAITLPDGSIAALPFINALPLQNYLWINKQWLTTLRLEEPATAEELTQVLEAFKTRDPNRNGGADEIPLAFLGPFDLKFLAHAFGLICNDYNVFLDDDGQVKFMPAEENFRSFISWCHDLYQRGLLDKNGFSTADTLRVVTDSNKTPTYGAILNVAASNVFQVSWSDQYVPLKPMTYGGKQIYRNFFGPVQRGTFAVTSACKNPEAMLQWVDYLYTEDGAKLATAGKENVDYLVDGDGTWRLVDSAQQNSTQFIAAVLIDGGAPAPGIPATEFVRRFNRDSQAARDVLQRQIEWNGLCVQPMPYLNLSREQEKEIAGLQSKIGPCVDIAIANWVMGEEEISDASFEKFYSELDSLGLADFLRFWQDAVDRR